MSHTTTIKSVPIRSRRALERAVAELNKAGIVCSLTENATPRLFYPNQLQKDKGRADNKADLVLNLPGCAYDVGLLRGADGAYEIVYDAYVPYGQKGVKDVLGVDYGGKATHWAGNRAETEEDTHGIAKFLQEYSKAEVIGVAEAQGHFVSSCDWNQQTKSWDILVQA